MRYSPVKAPCQRFFIRHTVAKTRARGAEGLVFAQTRALYLGCARAPGERWGLAAGRKQWMIPVFMYKKYTFNTPEGGMQWIACNILLRPSNLASFYLISD